MVFCCLAERYIRAGGFQAGLVLAQVLAQDSWVRNWVRDRVDFRVMGKVRGCFRVWGGVKVRVGVRKQLWIRKKKQVYNHGENFSTSKSSHLETVRVPTFCMLLKDVFFF